MSFVDVASHHFDARIFEGLAAFVVECDPADDLKHIALRRCDHVVAGVPGHSFGDVAELGRKRAGPVGLESPGESRLEDGVVGEGGEHGLTRKRKLELAVDFDDGLAAAALHVGLLRETVVLPVELIRQGGMRDESAADDLALNGGALPDLKVDGLAFVKRKQEFLSDWIVSVILFENLQAAASVERAQNHGVRLEVACNLADLNVVRAGLQVERQHFPDDRKLLVVNRQRGRIVRLIAARHSKRPCARRSERVPRLTQLCTLLPNQIVVRFA